MSIRWKVAMAAGRWRENLSSSARGSATTASSPSERELSSTSPIDSASERRVLEIDSSEGDRASSAAEAPKLSTTVKPAEPAAGRLPGLRASAISLRASAKAASMEATDALMVVLSAECSASSSAASSSAAYDAAATRSREERPVSSMGGRAPAGAGDASPETTAEFSPRLSPEPCVEFSGWTDAPRSE